MPVNGFQGTLRCGFIFPPDAMPEDLGDQSLFADLDTPDLALIRSGQPITKTLASFPPFTIALNDMIS